MDSMNLLLGSMGTAISIFSFAFGYRKTIGARKERVRSCNDEMEKILVRRIVLEGFDPSSEEIRRVVDAKARDFRVRSTDLLSESQLVNNIYTRIVESDFISLEQRQEVLSRLNGTIGATDESLAQEQSVEENGSRNTSREGTVYLMAMAASATFMGTLFVLLTDNNDFEGSISQFPEVSSISVTTAAVSLAMLSFMMIVYRLRERQQEEPSKAATLADYRVFEREVFKTLRKLGITPALRTNAQQMAGAYDFVIEHHRKKILVEVKNWSQNTTPFVVSGTLDRLRDALKSENANCAVVLTRKRAPSYLFDSEDDRIRILTLHEFRRHLMKQR